MDNRYQLGRIEAIFLLVILSISKLIANFSFYFVNTVGSGVIVNFIYIGIIDFVFMLLLICLQQKFKNSDIIDISEQIGGKLLKILCGLICITVLLLSAFITLKDFSSIIQKVYFSDFSTIYILMFFILAVLISNFIGFKSIARINLLIVPFVIIAILVTFFSIIAKADNKSMTPIFGDNYYKTFITGLSNIFIISNLSYILFLKPLLKNESDYKKISVISYIISWFCILLVLIVTELLFNSTPSKEPSSSFFLLVRSVTFGSFIERIDSVFVLLCVICVFSYLSFLVFLINRIFKKMFNITNEKMISYITCTFLFLLCLFPISLSALYCLENYIYRYMVIIFTFVFEFSILIIGNFKKRIRKEKI